MLSKFISVSKTRFQNTKTALKNQQALVQGLETQIDEEEFVEPEPEPRKEIVVSRGQDEEMSLKEVHEPFSSNSRGPIHEERRLQIEELDEWRTHKLRTHDKPKLCQDELNTFPNQLKIGDKVLLDAADPHIVTTKPNEEIPLTVLSIFSIFSFGTVETVMTNYNDPDMAQFRIGGLVRQLSIPEFGTALGLYTEEFKEENNLDALNRHIHRSPSKC
ncbi:hypothetical protein GOBAR_AA32523 [Gossypium barbadense]|uniref:Uncharacterized protein n=1 Tax=Gossypium barbadense TaxID=3634 RepID=A0A2P5WAT1_GOSBA|nr:hypothetical protein GOBAR_AA32523 [Gossypium barbadense]